MVSFQGIKAEEDVVVGCNGSDLQLQQQQLPIKICFADGEKTFILYPEP
jgi:hypothetical protein